MVRNVVETKNIRDKLIQCGEFEVGEKEEVTRLFAGSPAVIFCF